MLNKSGESSALSRGRYGDAMVQILYGEAEITIGDEVFNVKEGETIIMPSDVPHGLEAHERFKMLLTVIKSNK